MTSKRTRRRRQVRLPASLEAAWGLRPQPGRGPKRALTLGGIVQAGVDVAESEGLEAVSMSRVARELGAGTMALYRYVRAKEELLTLMVDAAFHAPPAAPAPSEGWRRSLARWARAHAAILRRHPWVLQIPLSGPPITPNLVMWFERGLRSFHGTRLPESEKLSVLLLVNGFVRNDAMLTADLRRAAGASGSAMKQATISYGRLLGQLVDPTRFPAITAVLASGAFDAPGGADSEFEFGLDRILDGVAVLLREGAGSV